MADYNSSYTGQQIDAAIGKALNPDTTVAAGSSSLVTSGAVASALNEVDPTITNNTDTTLSGVLIGKNSKIDIMAVDSAVATGSSNLITSGAVASALQNVDPTITSNTDTTLEGVLAGSNSKVATIAVDTAAVSSSSHLITSGAVKSAINFVPDMGNAGFHNSIYRGKSLGTSVTAAQYAEISAGTFNDMFIGDYWTISSKVYRIAAFDYWYNIGSTACTTHHVVLVPDASLTSAEMNNANITTGGYVGSDFYTGANSNTGKSTAESTINSAFGSAHILSVKRYFTNAVARGVASGWVEKDATVELMSEVMVYGTHAWGIYSGSSGAGYETASDKSQLPLFRFRHDLIGNRSNWWLRDVYTGPYFDYVYFDGSTGSYNAFYSFGVRPAFAICA